MTDQDRRRSGGKRPPAGSMIVVSLLRIGGGFLDLLHGKDKKTYSNMDAKEREVFSVMLEDMKQDLTKKGQKGE